MGSRFDRFRYHASADAEIEGKTRSADTFRGALPEDVPLPRFNSDEAAARFYLQELLSRESAAAFRSVASDDRPDRVPDLALVSAQILPATDTHLVRFAQTHRTIPVFGGEAIVELGDRNDLVSIDARLGDVGGISPLSNLTPEEAHARVAEATEAKLDIGTIPPATLTYFQGDASDDWHLTWHLRNVPARLPVTRPGPDDRGHGLGASPRDDFVRVDYLVDAHDGEIVHYFSVTPTSMPAVPTKCSGTDEDGASPSFWGRVNGTSFDMDDPIRHVRTFDLRLGDLATAAPPQHVIANGLPDFGIGFKGAVSAQVNATRVHDFYNSVLQRDGIDDKGMDLVSLVNCIYLKHGPGPEWRNAVWWNRRMWYGQTRDASGNLVSMARHLDVLAHELTHGVIETSSNLEYRDQSGALNESFADIFGTLIKNWVMVSPWEDVPRWSWELGPGLGPGILPLRDLSDPHRTGDPAHMNEYVDTESDYGGVHINSNIHNKAVYHLLTTVDAAGAPALSPSDAATLLYLALVRLPSQARFTDARQALVDVVMTYFAGNQPARDAGVAVIGQAYDQVGIA
jgi:Zn-dependent metalloprotease